MVCSEKLEKIYPRQTGVPIISKEEVKKTY